MSSFKVYVCDLLFGLNLNNTFDLDAVAKVFQEETGIEWPYEKSDLPLLIVNGFETVSDVLSYIICNDLIENTSDEKELFNTIRRIKRNNEKRTMRNLDKYKITFARDGFKSIQEINKRLYKK